MEPQSRRVLQARGGHREQSTHPGVCDLWVSEGARDGASAHVRLCVHMPAPVSVHTCACMYMLYVSAHVCAHACLCTHVHACTCRCAGVHVCAHARRCTHVCMPACVCVEAPCSHRAPASCVSPGLCGRDSGQGQRGRKDPRAPRRPGRAARRRALPGSKSWSGGTGRSP